MSTSFPYGFWAKTSGAKIKKVLLLVLENEPKYSFNYQHNLVFHMQSSSCWNQ